ncbi:MAG: hypothetical protein E4H13_00750 [Calditrichales bacterium]|nr:MAG: hypothetical protein E4H13_00750 [Calditrichales bacterium]
MKKISAEKTKYLYLGLLVIFMIGGCNKNGTDPESANPYMQYLSLEIDATTTLTVAIILPECFEPAIAYPALLAIPPGTQTRQEVQWAIDKYYIRQSIQRNWLVISPVAPNSVLFHEGSEVYIPMLLDEIQKAYEIEGGKFHLAGISSGGISAFRIAVLYPQRFASMTVFPGVPLPQDKPLLGQLAPIPVSMFVGENDDAEWVSEMDSTARILEQNGVEVDFTILADEGHIIDGLSSSFLFDLFDNRRP